MRRSTTLTVPFLILSACFNPDLSRVTILCSQSGECPDGRSCVDGRCAPPAGVMDDMSVATVDGGDLGVPDGGAADFAAPLLGCKGKGAKFVGPKARACPGAFPAGGAAAQCSDGAVPCTKYASVDAAACSGLGSFFVADVPAYYFGSMSNETCGTSLGSQLFYGCGTAGRPGVQKCMGFQRVIDLGTSLTSSNGSFSQLANQDPAQGVLCCLP